MYIVIFTRVFFRYLETTNIYTWKKCRRSVNTHRKHRRPILFPTNVRKSLTRARYHDNQVLRKEDAVWRAIVYRSMTTTVRPDNRAADTLSPGPRESSCNTSEIRVKYYTGISIVVGYVHWLRTFANSCRRNARRLDERAATFPLADSVRQQGVS